MSRQYSISLPVSLSKTALMTALIIAIGKRRWERASGVAFSWATSAQASMAFWMGERCCVLLRVLCAGALSSSLCGATGCAACCADRRGERRGTVALATLGAGATIGGARRGAVGVRKGKTRGESIVEGRSVLCAVCGLEMKTLRGRRGGTIGGY